MSKKSLLAALLCAVAVTGANASAAFAGEITGNGKPTQGPAHANSICTFSGLEDGDGAGFPGPGGAPPQNWGHVQQAERAAGATPRPNSRRRAPSRVTPATVTVASLPAAVLSWLPDRPIRVSVSSWARSSDRATGGWLTTRARRQIMHGG
jgi:hypothetical protein